ncbi:MAG: primosomal protein N' [Cryomorphaceae bacterium]
MLRTRSATTFAQVSSDYHIHVILPLALRGAFTYRVPPHLKDDIDIGKRVVVPFGKRRYYAGLIYRLNVEVPKGTKAKDIQYIMDDLPVVTDLQLSLWEWMADYYMSGLGPVMNTALPSALKLSSKTVVALNPAFEEYIAFTDDERMVVAQLASHEQMEVSQLEALASKRSIQKAISSLLKKGVILTSEEMKPQPKPRVIERLELMPSFQEEGALNDLIENLSKAPKQFELVMRFLEITGGDLTDGVNRPLLLQRSNASAAILRSLIDKGVFQRIEVLAHAAEGTADKSIELNDEQLGVLHSLKEQFESKVCCLLQGVTGSGKTMVYAELIKDTLAAGKQVLYLVPEIALTTQLVERMKHLVQQEVQVYHSRFTDRERLTTWLRLLDSANPELVIGARSSLFLPFQELGLIIVDEEHESSFKQHESSPHYHARDAAIWMAHAQGAKVLIGSATPSVESVFSARKGKFGFAELKKRFANIQLPSIHIVDMTKSKRADVMDASFSAELVEGIKAAMVQKQQVILFQNRRGYAPFLICESCGWSAECVNCDVNLTFHKHFEKMLCHYCGYNYKLPKNCPQCNSAKLKVKGFGTEKIEDQLEAIFPEARIARMDLDTTRKKNAFQNLITAFEEGSIDILVGTQMVSKGLDFENVGLVGVLSADALWNRPDFRAFERAFQMLTQVSGRAGRKGRRGKVIVQTFRIDHPVLEYVVNNSYEGMYQHQISERQQFAYPPYTRIIQFKLLHTDAKFNREAAGYFAGLLRERFGKRILGPEEPPIPRIRGRFIRQIILKMDGGLSLKQSRSAIWECVDLLEGHESYRKVRLQIDVDPS